MRILKREANGAALFALGAGVGVLVGVAAVGALLLVIDAFEDDGEPSPAAHEVERIARAWDRIERSCAQDFDLHRDPSPAERRRAQEALKALRRQYRRTPLGEFRLDDSAEPMTMQDLFTHIVYSTYDGPCPELAKAAKSELSRERRLLTSPRSTGRTAP